MKFEMVMPKMGESIMDGTILKWLKQPGDTVEKDEIILEISTDKVDSEIPAPVSGTISQLLAAEGDTVDVGSVIALFETDQAVESSAPAPQAETVEEETVPVVAAAPAPAPKSKPQGARFYSPVVMNIANENGIAFAELETIPGSGLNGRVTKKDIMNYIAGRGKAPRVQAAAPAAPAGFTGADGIEVIEMDRMRKSIAEHMIKSKHTSAHVSLYAEIDMQNISRIRERNKKAFKAREGFSLTYMPFIAEATTRALKEFPMLNASIDGDRILVKHFVNLGIAVAVEAGLIVPNIFHADERNLTGLARAINDVATRARDKKLKPDEVVNGTFSISNFGVYGTSVGFPIINQPQVAILGVGAIKKRPVVINDAIAIRPIMYLSLTIDHRLIDGAMGAQFLQRVGQLLEGYDPEMSL
ncbi:MAG TPA: 2-oxo acid dehydrogenase subunit E2 [Caldithrix abyssi]|uniref:Dihydrolipoamide acetyltransferase component of pyruvate dehydrogenase complex n=1 Tax=Caldithrix abyssi TaxID=187145 RepID=A0A7V4TYN5_CALAY|nr:2-oxo acid dehydrogenase subunit E2 [Caldithrix abyssi]